MIERHYPIGAEPVAGGGVHFRVWAPKRQRVHVVLESGPSTGERFPLEREDGGYFSGLVDPAEPGTRYRFQLDGSGGRFPDPASRFQPDGPHGPSEVIDGRAFAWTDSAWRGLPLRGQILYEMHVGAYTPEGTWASARRQLPELAECGITVLELMPVADFPGRFGWGYDGVGQFAPTWLYGTPDDFRRFVDAAHGEGIAVLLDVVYNHFGPEGCYLREFSDEYFSAKYENEWGDPLNFDGPSCGPVREHFLANAAYWIEEFHLDGLRLDATQQIYDSGPEHIVTAVGRAVRAAARGRETILVAENEPQESQLVRPVEQGGFGLDALWNDDFHHSAMVAVTGRNEAYYTDYRGAPQEFLSAVKYGYLYQGQWYAWQKQRRGTAGLDLPPAAFITFAQNHDQIANSGRGLRVHQLASPGNFRAVTALLLLAPGTPMLFMGQEFAASTPFLYFADHNPGLAKLVCQGRLKFLGQFRSLANAAMQALMADPGDPSTFLRCKLDFSERDRNAGVYRMHKDLIRLRRSDAAFARQERGAVDGAVLGPDAFVLRFFGATHDEDRLLLVNFGIDLPLGVAPEPLLGPPRATQWTLRWSSEDPEYGGAGVYTPDDDGPWRIPGKSAVVLAPHPAILPLQAVEDQA